ncbi:MAG: hypothetical protein FWG36_01720 [Oscillospiraceae bacterium]|nr:hypothetical protein [Oscillospiraceae bacterium]
MKKNRFYTFLLSMIPGCGHMFLGYMRKGLQLMLMFAAAGFLTGVFGEMLNGGWIMIFFIILMPVIWFYQVFDAMHLLTRLRDLNLERPDDDGFFWPSELGIVKPSINRTLAKIFAAVLIFTGIFGIINKGLNSLDILYRFLDYSTAQSIINFARYDLLQILLSLVLIIAGICLLVGRKKKKNRGKEGDA